MVVDPCNTMYSNASEVRKPVIVTVLFMTVVGCYTFNMPFLYCPCDVDSCSQTVVITLFFWYSTFQIFSTFFLAKFAYTHLHIRYMTKDKKMLAEALQVLIFTFSPKAESD